MNRGVAAGAILLAALSGCSAGSAPAHTQKSTPGDSGSPVTECTAATARATARAVISRSGIEPDCVTVSKRDSFTLLNDDALAHSFSTTDDSPVRLQVDLKKGAAFPYRFKKAGTYTLEDTTSDLRLTIIVR